VMPHGRDGNNVPVVDSMAGLPATEYTAHTHFNLPLNGKLAREPLMNLGRYGAVPHVTLVTPATSLWWSQPRRVVVAKVEVPPIPTEGHGNIAMSDLNRTPIGDTLSLRTGGDTQSPSYSVNKGQPEGNTDQDTDAVLCCAVLQCMQCGSHGNGTYGTGTPQG